MNFTLLVVTTHLLAGAFGVLAWKVLSLLRRAEVRTRVRRKLESWLRVLLPPVLRVAVHAIFDWLVDLLM